MQLENEAAEQHKAASEARVRLRARLETQYTHYIIRHDEVSPLCQNLLSFEFYHVRPDVIGQCVHNVGPEPQTHPVVIPIIEKFILYRTRLHTPFWLSTQLPR